jgi:3',5'-cyclic AMP phosphodiesterase CpdA
MNGAESTHPMFTFAHLSDPHLAIQSAPGLRSLMNKRLIGYLSWRTKRRAIHETRVLAALTEAIKQAETDHIAITGDLTNIALPAEFKEARRWLDGFGPAQSITLVPGNHDAYVGVPWSASLGQWADYMRGDGQQMNSPEDFPTVRIRGPVAFVGISSAHPSAPHLAVGSVGQEQLAEMEQRLAELGREKLLRIVLIHHPPVPGTVKPRASLLDAGDFADAIARAGAELVLHGHTHRMSHQAIMTPRGPVPVIGVASASARAQHAHREQAQFHLYTVSREAEQWRLDLEIRGLDEGALTFRTVRKLPVPLPA